MVCRRVVVVVVQVINDMKKGKAPGPSHALLELISASGEVENQVVFEVCQVVQDGLGMLAECDICIMFPMFKGNGDIRNCSYH